MSRPAVADSRTIQIAWVAVACAAVAAGQVGPRPPSRTPRVLVASSAQVLWLARVERGMSVLFARPAPGPFDLGRAISRSVAALTVLGDDALVCLPDGQLYLYPHGHSEPLRQRQLPGGRPPIDLYGTADRLFALIRLDRPASLGRVHLQRLTVSTQPASAPAGRMLIVISDASAWGLLFAAPAGVPETGRDATRPKLYVADRSVLLFSALGDQGVRVSVRGVREAAWHEPGMFAVPDLRGFWPVDLAGVPALVVASGASGGTRVRVYRLLGRVDQAVTRAWRPVALRWSDAPADVRRSVLIDAVGFNQHVGLLWRDPDGGHHLQFGAVGPPTERTLEVEALWHRQTNELRSRTAWQALSIAVMLAVLIGLFVFRRDALTRPLALPADVVLAPTTRRVVAWLIDMVPFAIAAARVSGLDLRAALLGLARWGLSPDLEAAYPSPELLRFWLLTAAGHTVYLLVMELATRRSVGKALLGLRVADELIRPPGARALLLRNLVRLIELMPQFWIFVLLVPFSRNRQRLGDLLARTVVVRRVRRGRRADPHP